VRERLEGMPVHGVPFTAEVTRDGLLSWGIDPPPATRAAAPENRGSWRFWVVNKLAEYLLTATTDGVAQPWQFALDRLLVDGVDTDTWVPAGTLWDHPAAAS
jgi:hypothetical protein